MRTGLFATLTVLAMLAFAGAIAYLSWMTMERHMQKQKQKQQILQQREKESKESVKESDNELIGKHDRETFADTTADPLTDQGEQARCHDLAEKMCELGEPCMGRSLPFAAKNGAFETNAVMAYGADGEVRARVEADRNRDLVVRSRSGLELSTPAEAVSSRGVHRFESETGDAHHTKRLDLPGQGAQLCVGSLCLTETELQRMKREPEVGPQGDRGDRGARGPKGDRGRKGSKGARGRTGGRGATGYPGFAGDRGDAGDRGPKGYTGSDGIRGLTHYAARLYSDCDFRGESFKVYYTGDYNKNEMVAHRIYNDRLSSVYVRPGFKVVLYEHHNFSGDTRTLTSSERCLKNQSFNDHVSSFKVMKA